MPSRSFLGVDGRHWSPSDGPKAAPVSVGLGKTNQFDNTTRLGSQAIRVSRTAAKPPPRDLSKQAESSAVTQLGCEHLVRMSS